MVTFASYHGFFKLFCLCLFVCSSADIGGIKLRDAWHIQNGWLNGGGGGGVIFNPKNYIADFGPLNRAFWAWNLYKKSKFRVQGMFFSTIVLRKIKTRHTLKKAYACISYCLALIPPCIYATISIIKKNCLEFFQKFIPFGSVTHPKEKI